MHPIRILLVLACALLLSSGGTLVAGATPARIPYYLALGDSITVGTHRVGRTQYSGDRTCTNHALDSTGQGGWVCLFWGDLRTVHPYLQLENFALDGEDSCSFITGTVCGVSLRGIGGGSRPPYNPATTSQLQAALHFLHRHKVKVISFEIGGNDLLSLLIYGLNGAAQHLPAALKQAEQNYDRSLRQLRRAAPHATLVLFDLYNPLSGGGLTFLLGGTSLPRLFDKTAQQYALFVRAEAIKYHAVFVDLKTPFEGNAARYVGDDFIHPSAAGNREIATLAWDAYQAAHHRR